MQATRSEGQRLPPTATRSGRSLELRGPTLKGSLLTQQPRSVPERLARQPVSPYPIVTEGWLTPVRHRDQATRTPQTAHPQFQAGRIAPHPATVSMSLHRLALAPRCGGHAALRGIRHERLHSKAGICDTKSIGVYVYPGQGVVCCLQQQQELSRDGSTVLSSATVWAEGVLALPLPPSITAAP